MFGGTVEAVDGKEGLGEKALLIFSQVTVLQSLDYAKAFDCVDHNKLWKILKEMGIPDHLNLPPETWMQVKKQQLESYMEQWTGSKDCHKLYIVTCLFNLYAEHIM